MRRKWLGLRFFFALGLAASVVFGCATPTEVIQLHRAPPSSAEPYAKILVVNVSPDRQQQVDFENEVIGRIRTENVEGIAAHSVLDSSNELQQAELDRAAGEVSADAILIMHIVSLDTTADISEGRSEILSECRGGDPLDYFLYDHTVISEPDSVRFAHTVTVVSNLYDAKTRERLWTIQSTCFEKSTMSEVIRDEANAIVRQLGIDGLI